MNTTNPVGNVCPPNLNAPQNGAGTVLQPSAPEKFTPEKAEKRMVLFCLILGFLFARWLLWGGFAGWGVSAFTLLFAAGVLLYARAKKAKPSAESWFWMGIMLLCALAFGLFPAGILQGWQVLLLFSSAIYWCACLFGTLLKQKTSNFLPLDVCNSIFAIPAKNRSLPFESFPRFSTGKQRRKALWKQIVPVAIGLLICIPFLAIVLPLLFRADGGGFQNFFAQIGHFIKSFSIWNRISDEAAMIFAQIILALPIAWYLGSLLFGSANKRHVQNISPLSVEETKCHLRFVPTASVVIVLGMASAVYVLFVAFQAPYFFSAFSGMIPAGYAAYSAYAREGFFELCAIAAINLGLLCFAGCLCKSPARGSRVLRVLNSMLTILTVLVLATAFSKMILYINVYGFTQKRLMTCVFMLFLAGICVAVLLFQFKPFSLVRFAAIYGAGLLCALCLCNLNGIVARYNAQQYLNGNLEEFTMQTIYSSGTPGYQVAKDVYLSLDEAEDEEFRGELATLIVHLEERAHQTTGTSQDTLINAWVRAQEPLPEDERAGVFPA